MSREPVFRRIARTEFDEAVAWYESERPGLGLEFNMSVDALLTAITQQPTLFRQVRGPIRRAVLKRFPYTSHFLDEPSGIVVLAVYHAARNPRVVARRE